MYTYDCVYVSALTNTQIQWNENHHFSGGGTGTGGKEREAVRLPKRQFWYWPLETHNYVT